MQGKQEPEPVIIAIGGGKGGVGKSVLSILLGHWLARLGRETVVVDLDLGGANTHTLLGIKDPPATIQDLLSRRIDSLGEALISTETEGLSVICGASEILSAANPPYAQKQKIMRRLLSLQAEFVVLDLGAGTSLDVLDFFLMADRQIVVTTAEPIAIYNAYAFLRNSVFRRLAHLYRQMPDLAELVKGAMDPRNPLGIQTVRGLYERLVAEGGSEWGPIMEKALAGIHPLIVVNQVREPRERNTGKILQQVAERYLMIEVEELGCVGFDPTVASTVCRMDPLTQVNGYGSASEGIHEMASHILATTEEISSEVPDSISPPMDSEAMVCQEGSPAVNHP